MSLAEPSAAPEFGATSTLIWPPPAQPALRGDELDLWWIAAEVAADQPRRTRSQTLLRSVLASYMGMPAGELQFDREAHGRPYLRHPGAPDFNLSDTQGGSVIAVSGRGRVGIDLERSDRRPPAQRLAARWFSAAETAALARLDPDLAAQSFLHLWTAKEAACKATGSGIFGWLKQWRFDPQRLQPALIGLPEAAGEASAWTFLRLQPAPDYTCVVACWGLRPQLRRLLRVSA